MDRHPDLGPGAGPGDHPDGHLPAAGALDLDAVARTVLATPPRLGDVRLVCVDGPAGSGKTTLAGRLGEHLGCPVVHLDDLYGGWDGLGRVWHLLATTVLEPLAAGRDAEQPVFDWELERFGPALTVPWADLLVVEGCGAAQRAADPVAVLKIWVEAPSELRLARGLDRDGVHQRVHWEHWMDAEDRHFAAHDTRARADLHLDGSRLDPVPAVPAAPSEPRDRAGSRERAEPRDR